MNCKEALEKIYEFLDRDGSVSIVEIEVHLNRCRGCWDRFEFEKQLLARIKQSCCKETCSDTLKQRIQSIIDQY